MKDGRQARHGEDGSARHDTRWIGVLQEGSATKSTGVPDIGRVGSAVNIGDEFIALTLATSSVCRLFALCCPLPFCPPTPPPPPPRSWCKCVRMLGIPRADLIYFPLAFPPQMPYRTGYLFAALS